MGFHSGAMTKRTLLVPCSAKTILGLLVCVLAAGCHETVARPSAATPSATPPSATIGGDIPARASSDRRDPAASPPGGLTPAQVPLFVVFGFDDNGISGVDGSGGLRYVNEQFRRQKNPPGRGNRATFDGTPAHFTLYGLSRNVADKDVDQPENVKREWHAAYAAGNELAIHTATHPHGRELSVAEWERELTTCKKWMTKPFEPSNAASPDTGIGVPAYELVGFRTPYLEYNDNTFEAMARFGLRYDCSIEEGWQDGQNGTDYLWPYTLDQGSPGNAASGAGEPVPKVTSHPGLWELPAYAFIVPPDELCDAYAAPKGLRDRMKKAQVYFDTASGKITGLDWNLWIEFGMTKAEFVATLKHTLDLRLAGNRAPLTVGMHSDIYSTHYPENTPFSTAKERQEALRAVLEYALGKPEVRVTSAKELLGWLRQPAAL